MSDEPRRGIVAEMTGVYHDLGAASDDLRTARDEEVNAKHEYESRHRRALLDPARPKVERNGWTVDERNAWVGEEARAESLAFELFKVRRESAADHLRTLRDQAMLLMAIAKAREAEMRLSGVQT